ncbi:unnamed protein product [Bemisia tabaci]|uniref:ADP-dependent glucokinase n=1 Tax=Bemisia tabaci TaxID=7038 RepID=A0A9P0A3Q0_BEMTA|nr:unnamed protein product [Bemisia tabaci]
MSFPGGSKVISVGLFCSMLGILIALFLSYPNDVLVKRMNKVLNGLLEAEKFERLAPPKVAVGYGACLDLVVDAQQLLPTVDDIDARENFDYISSMEELYQSYSYYFQHGTAAERYISNTTLFNELITKAASLPSSRYSVGGNAPVMATRFALEGCSVMLSTLATPSLREKLLPDLQIVGGETSHDDIHLILEYKADEEWGHLKAPRANRFIVHNDKNNPLITSLEELDSNLGDFGPDLLVVSGLQMMNGYPFPSGVREERIEKIREQINKQPSSTRIHFEMASFTEISLLDELLSNVIPFSNSLGMNEIELENLLSILKYGNISYVSDSNPRVATVLDQMRQVYKLITDKSRNIKNSRMLTRLHVHTLAYQVILTTQPSRWKHSRAAAARAALTAHRYICGTSEVDVDRAKLILNESFSTSRIIGSRRVSIIDDSPVSCWTESPQFEICVAPVLVCTSPRQTAGGGDNISAAGLAPQL